jgi:hypothetical protein
MVIVQGPAPGVDLMIAGLQIFPVLGLLTINPDDAEIGV